MYYGDDGRKVHAHFRVRLQFASNKSFGNGGETHFDYILVVDLLFTKEEGIFLPLSNKEGNLPISSDTKG